MARHLRAVMRDAVVLAAALFDRPCGRNGECTLFLLRSAKLHGRGATWFKFDRYRWYAVWHNGSGWQRKLPTSFRLRDGILYRREQWYGDGALFLLHSAELHRWPESK